MRRLALFVLLLASPLGFAQAPNADAAAKTALDAYAEAINKQNLEALGGFWAENAEHIDDEGTATKGREKIVAMFKKIFADQPKLSVKLASTSARFLGSEVLLIDGTAEVKNGNDTDTSMFESIWVKSGDKWQLSRVRELPSPDAGGDSNYEKLKELEWLVGDWTAEAKDYSVTLHVKWAKNKNFLFVEQSVATQGKETVSVTKIIGWDSGRESLRTWFFDSDGGFGGALVAREGNTWIEAGESLTRNGGEGTAKHTSKFVDDNTFEWSSTERRLDSAPLPDLKLKYTRKPAGK